MSIFTFHLVKTSVRKSLSAIWFTPKKSLVPGLVHMECMVAMTLGSPILSKQRFLPRELVVFAQWENEQSLGDFLLNHSLGKTLEKGWHVRLSFVRQWGYIDDFKIPSEADSEYNPENTVVAVTLARMKMMEVPRFIRWGRPVEKQVRDNPNTFLSLAATRLPHTVSTFSIWNSEIEMVKMVHGRNTGKDTERHAQAMKERDRKDFHKQFTTLRFKPISEHGEWLGKKNYIPELKNESRKSS